MTTVANQPVGPDSISGHVKGGTSSGAKNHPGFLGAGIAPGMYQQESAGTPGGKLGPGSGFPLAAAGILTGLESNKLAK